MPRSDLVSNLAVTRRMADARNIDIASALGVTERSVERYRKQLGLPAQPPRPLTHGPSGYNRGCRCEICSGATAERNARNFQERLERGLPKGDPRHGTVNGYTNWSCRCAECRAANTERGRVYHGRD